MRTLVDHAKTTSKSLLTRAKIICFSFLPYTHYVNIDNGENTIQVDLLRSNGPLIPLSVYPANYGIYKIYVAKLELDDVDAMKKWPKNAQKELENRIKPTKVLQTRLGEVTNLKITFV